MLIRISLQDSLVLKNVKREKVIEVHLPFLLHTEVQVLIQKLKVAHAYKYLFLYFKIMLTLIEPKTRGRPPKPTMAPPPPRPGSHSPSPRPSPSPTRELEPRNRSPRHTSPAPMSDAVTVKIHYTSTRAIRIAKSTDLHKLLELVCKKFEKQEGSLSLW